MATSMGGSCGSGEETEEIEHRSTLTRLDTEQPIFTRLKVRLKVLPLPRPSPPRCGIGDRMCVVRHQRKRAQKEKESGPHPALTQRRSYSAPHKIAVRGRISPCRRRFRLEGFQGGCSGGGGGRETSGKRWWVWVRRGRRLLPIGRPPPWRDGIRRTRKTPPVVRRVRGGLNERGERPARWQKRCDGEPGWAGSYLCTHYT